MAFNAIEIAALVLVIIGLIKLLVLSFNANTWLKVVKAVYGNPVVTFVVELVLAVVLFYYLLQQFTIVQIMSVIALGALLTGMTFAAYGKETIDWASKILRTKSLIRKAWLPILIWLGLTVWTLIALFK